MTDFITPVVDAWVNNVFGTPFLAGIIFMFFIILWGVKRGWTLDMFTVILVPFVFIMALPAVGAVLPPILWVVIIIIMSIVVGLGLVRVIRG